MIDRKIEQYLDNVVKKYRTITLVGPRQSGKTTLSRKYFPNHVYFSLEDPDTRSRVMADPRGFVNQLPSSVIIDEVQRFPDLLSYLQGIIDEKTKPLSIVLTGSNSLLLSEKISQSLAGRTRILTILPFLREEIPDALRRKTLNETLYYGSYPRIYDEQLEPYTWYGDYVQTYVEKDVRSMINVSDLNTFDRYLRLVAGRSGQLFNSASLGNDVGISAPTAKNWLSVLEASFITFSLGPYFNNFSKRLIKTPKIYFYDTGLLCYLLRIRDAEQLETHPLRGSIFENWVIAEYMKKIYSDGQLPSLYFWRDQSGHEVDLMIDQGSCAELIEIKSSQTFHDSFLKQLQWLNGVSEGKGGRVVYGGDDRFHIKDYEVVSWRAMFI